jgi:23S rRNA pseudouridine2605 synthase
MKIVLQKFIAEAGYSSRRKAEEFIRDGRVTVNGKPAELGMKADDNDDVRVNREKIILNQDKIYIILNKPKGYICTSRKFEGERNVFELLENPPQPSLSKREGDFGRLFVVGRLDKESRGLVLLTNDGDLTQKITHPKYEHEKEYIVRMTNFQETMTKQIMNDIIFKFKKGIDIGEGDGVVMVKNMKLINFDKEKNIVEYSIILTEGKKRQIRRMFKALDCHILDLLRVRIGAINLGSLKEGSWRYLNQGEIVKLLHC